MSKINLIKTLIGEVKLPMTLSNHSVFIVRVDGVILFSNEKGVLKKSADHIGALVAGLWQAAEMTQKLLGNEDQSIDYRLGFDSTESGLFILPINRDNELFLIGTIYSEMNNPAVLKNNLRQYRDKLEFYELEEQCSNDSKVLFENITDDEMNKIFEGVGK